MPGDELLLDPSFNAARAIAIDAPRESVWRASCKSGTGFRQVARAARG
jgi:hypothetical protein